MTIDANSLEPGEQLLWHDKPDVAAYSSRNGLTAKTFYLGFFALLAGTLLALYGRPNGTRESVFDLGPALILVGVGVMYFPLRIWHEPRRTHYAMTNQRAIVETWGLLLRNRISVPFSEIRKIEVREPPYGKTGDLIFRDYVYDSDNGLQVSRGGFLAIADVRKVEQLLRKPVESQVLDHRRRGAVHDD